MNIKSKFIKLSLFVCILVLGIGCDQTTKEIAKEQLAYQAPVQYYEGLFTLAYYENTGAFLSMGEHLSPDFKLVFLLLLPFLVLVGVTFHIFKGTYSLLYFLGFCLLIAGGIGNLIDRWLEGFVVDFMHISLGGPIQTGVFNFADVFITTGICLVFFHLLRTEGN